MAMSPRTGDSATFTVGLAPDADGRYYFRDGLSSFQTQVALAGKVHAILPVYFPTSSNHSGQYRVCDRRPE